MATDWKAALEADDEKRAQNYAEGLSYCDWHHTMETFTEACTTDRERLLRAIEVMDDIAWATSHEEGCARRPYGDDKNCDCHISMARNFLSQLRDELGVRAINASGSKGDSK